MSSGDLRQHVVDGITQFWNKKDIGAVSQYYHQNLQGHDPGGLFEGDLARFTATASAVMNAFEDLRVVDDDIIIAGDRAICRWRASGRHTGMFNGIPATGNMVEFTGINIYRFRDDKVIEIWSNSDTLTFMQCLGVVPRFGEQQIEATG